MPSAEQFTSNDASTKYSTKEIGQMLFDIKKRLANTENMMMANCFDQEAFMRQQIQFNKSMDENLAKLLLTVEKLNNRPPDSAPTPPATRGWTVPASITMKPASYNTYTWPPLKLDPPRFDGGNVTRWITQIQTYYNHSFTPLADRLYLTQFLLDDAAAEWFTYWELNNDGKAWDDFLLDAKLCFDPDLYENHIGRLASLHQTGSLEAYISEFETTLSKVGNVGASSLSSLFIAGLQPSLKAELLTRRPATLSKAIAVARQLAIAHSSQTIIPSLPPRSSGSRDTNPSPKYTPPHIRTPETPLPSPSPGHPSREGPPKDYPIVRISAAERAGKAKRVMGAYDDDATAPADPGSDPDSDAENIILLGEDPPPRPVPYHGLLALLEVDTHAELYELVPLPAAPDAAPDASLVLPTLQPLLDEFSVIFKVPGVEEKQAGLILKELYFSGGRLMGWVIIFCPAIYRSTDSLIRGFVPLLLVLFRLIAFLRSNGLRNDLRPSRLRLLGNLHRGFAKNSPISTLRARWFRWAGELIRACHSWTRPCRTSSPVRRRVQERLGRDRNHPNIKITCNITDIFRIIFSLFYV